MEYFLHKLKQKAQRDFFIMLTKALVIWIISKYLYAEAYYSFFGTSQHLNQALISWY